MRYTADMTENEKKRGPLIAVAVTACVICLGLVIFETIGGESLFETPPPAFTLGMSAAERILLAVAFTCLAVIAGYADGFVPRLRGGAVAAIAALAVAIANFPFFTLASGELTFTANAGTTALYLLNCLAIGLFEETAFRGLLLPFVRGRMSGGKLADIGAILLSSAVFALFHLLNLLSGASVGGTLTQVGYTFLTGCMFGTVTLLSRSIIPGIVIHTLYDIGGTMTAYGVAVGSHWNTPAAIVMAVVSVLAAAVLIASVLKKLRGA